jgi:hypothetical protein
MGISVSKFRVLLVEEYGTKLDGDFGQRAQECCRFLEKLNKLGARAIDKVDAEEISNIEDFAILEDSEMQDLEKEFSELIKKFPLKG